MRKSTAASSVREPDARYLAAPATLVDSCVLIDVLADDPQWADWSLEQLDLLGNQAPLVINPLILAEISPRFERAADLETALSALPLKREALPWDAAFLAGQAFKAYRAQSVPGRPKATAAPLGGSSVHEVTSVGVILRGNKTSPMPDFYIGAHALVAGMRLLTRDTVRYASYFPKLTLVAP